jgi:ADP-ribose pyrophosphatase YjhB (NUDIX family)
MEVSHVVTCFLEHSGKIALLRRSGRVGTYQGRWAGVSGYIEEGHTPYQQALEEIKEEAGLEEPDVNLLKEGVTLEVVDEGLGRKWVVHPYRFRVLKPEKMAIDWEHSEMRWIEPKQIAEYETVPQLAEAWQRVAD